MPTRFIKQNSDINVWGAVLGDALSRLRLVTDIKIVANGNNPPTVQSGTNFQVYGTDTFTSSPATPTLNNVYPANTSITYYLDSVIFELADQTFAWNTAAGATSAGIPAKSNSTTYYLFCNGGQDVDSTSRGKGKYGVSTNAPTYDAVKKGWYSSDGLVLLMFKTDGSGNVLTTAGNWLQYDQTGMTTTTILSSAGTTITTSGLSIIGGEFQIKIKFKQATLGRVSFYINADSTPTNYYSNLNLDAPQNQGYIMYNDTNNYDGQCIINMHLNPISGLAHAIGFNASGGTGGSNAYPIVNWLYKTPVSDITSIQFVGLGNFSAGSIVTVKKIIG